MRNRQFHALAATRARIQGEPVGDSAVTGHAFSTRAHVGEPVQISPKTFIVVLEVMDGLADDLASLARSIRKQTDMLRDMFDG